jgi:glycosyltransferase involved in cell wall biosynthesis
MKILIIDDEPWDSGILRCALDLCAVLSKRGHGLYFWGRGPGLAEARRLGIPTRELSRPWLAFPSYLAAARKIEPDVIDTFTGSAQSFGAALSALTGAPLVRTCADARLPKGHALAKTLASWTSLYIAANSGLERHLRHSFKRAKIEMIFPGVAEPAAVVPALPREPVIGLLGRFDPVKGHSELIRAAAILSEKGIPLSLQFAGSGRLEAEIKALAKRSLPSGTANFHGRVSEIGQFISKCRIGCIPSTGSEAVSRAALEWMAMGRPVIATRVGGLPDIIEDGVTGYLVSPRKPQAFARALAELIEEPALAERMGRAGRKRFERFSSLSAFAAASEKALARVIAR